MTNNSLDDTNPYLLQARFNRWCNRRYYAWAAGLTEEERRLDRGAFFGSIHSTLDHTLAVDRLWLDRMEGRANPTTSFRVVQIEDFDQLNTARAVEDDRLIKTVGQMLHDATLEAPASFRYISGESGLLSRHLILLTMFNHQAHHRGQVHAMFTQAGLVPEDSDLVDYLNAVKANAAEA